MSDEQKLREYLRKVTGDLRKAHRRVRELEQRRREPIAIVGMSCRYPSRVRLPEELWQLVSSGTDAISELPVNRGWDVERFYDPDFEHPGSTYCGGGGFIEDIAGFDAAFFGIGPRDALEMDPQQRLILELSWEALEDAGIDPTSLGGTATGVFTGSFYQDYGPSPEYPLASASHDVPQPGSSTSMLCGRVSYQFGLQGPAVTVDTSCSSSLVALHLACQSLRRGECSLALAGGVTLMSHPTLLALFSRARALSPDGRCRSFAAGADGTGFSDGAGQLVLERLSDARRLGHRVLAVVRGSAINQDGASNGLTAPNGPSQERVIRQALADAGLSPAEVDAVEAHGTGTPLGDPIEAQALIATYGQGRTDGPLRLGSIKSNIGHSSAGSGVAGVIKMVKALEHELLPATLHVDEPSPHVDWSAGEVRLLLEPEPWPAGERPRRAGISSFGASGTNAHVIIEEPPRIEDAPPSSSSSSSSSSFHPPAAENGAGDNGAAELAQADAGPSAGAWSCGVVPLVVSSRGEDALCDQAHRLRELLLKERPDADSPDTDAGLLDVAFSAAGRAVLEDRGVVLARDRGGLIEGLEALAGGGVGEGVVRGVAREGRPVFVFPGQGAQWEGMAVELLEASPVFAEALRACGRALEELVDWRVEDVLRGVEGAPGLESVDVVQPVSFAVMVALAELWRSFGVRPAAVVGHSQGEIAAACVAGGLSLEDAARVVVLRSRLLGEVLAGRGGMVSVALDVERVQQRLDGWGGRLSVAAVNGPSTVIVSGESGALEELLQACEGDGVWARRVAVDYASHSVAVEELREQLIEALAGIEPVSCGVPFFSTATGAFLDTAELDGEYWYRGLRERVRFEEAVRALAPTTNAFVEVSPHPVLGVAVRETLEDLGVEESVAVLGSLRREQGGPDRFVHSLAEAWVAGVGCDWRGLFAGSGAQRVALPKYAFQRTRYWLSPSASVGDVSGVGLAVADHPLLGAAVQVAGGEGWLFTGRLSLDTHGWLADHVVFESVVVPGTALLELVLAAGRIAGCEAVEELTLQAPLVLAPGGAAQLQVLVGEPDGEGRREVSVHSRPQVPAEDGEETDGGWTRHAVGALLIGAADAAQTAGATAGAGGADAAGAAGLGVPGLGPQWPPAGAQELDAGLLYDRLIEGGFGYGPLFQGVKAAWRKDDEIYTEVTLPQEAASDAAMFGVHPALLDAALHGLFFLGMEEEGAAGALPLPFSLGGVSVARRGATSLRVRLARAEGSTRSVSVWDDTGAPVLAMRSLALRMVQAGQLAGAQREDRGSLMRHVWVPAPLLDAGGQPRIAMLGDTAAPDLEGDRHDDLAALVRAIEEGTPAPDHVFVAAPAAPQNDAEAGLASMAHANARQTLELLQAWLAQPQLAESQLVLLTRGAVALADGDAPALAAAPIWGLARSAQSESPGRVMLVDLDPHGEVDAGEEGRIAWPALLAAEEPQLALRGGRAYVPRLESISAAPEAAPALDPAGTVLVTGGTGGLGALVARHLAGERGARHLLLASRSGPRAPGAQELLAELQELGCEARVAACDVSDRRELAALLDSIPVEHPLRVVVHTAGVLEDGLVSSLTAEQLERVMRPKVDAALHLHELTRELELSELVLFSSFTATIGSPGQANYAAANAFLDALAQHRRAHGLPGKALAWGLWEQASGMTADLDEDDRARMARQGVSALPSASGLELLDAGRGSEEALLVAARLDPSALRKQARVGVLPVLLSGLVRMPVRRSRGEGGSLARRLAETPESEWDAVVLELVRGEAAAVLGRESAAEVDPELAFKDLGFDSLGALELRNRLMQTTGLRLPATLVFDHPNCGAVAKLLRSRVEVRGGAPSQGRGALTRRVRDEEPIALVGMACRFPGDVRSPAELWELLVEGRDAVSGFPRDRGWDLAGIYDPDPDHPRTSYVREGGFLYDIADFDADFFGISPREALTMDPNQRLLLETAWEAFEDAGIDPTSLRGSSTGVYAGVPPTHYAIKVPEKLEGLQLTGNSPSVASGRVSYTFGLEGPSMSVDTACSSSLVAMHLACRALRDGECELALAGGVTLMPSPGMFIEFSRQRGLALDGRCKPFAAAADGVGWAEGAGLVALERLSDAQRLGHRVLALVRGSAVNQDGASNGLAAPNGPSQERVIRQALADAGLTPGEIDAVEAHGTGTRLGDPIEAQALLATYGQERRDGPVRVGSIKSNIGHSIAASGVAGVMKIALALRHELLPQTLHVDEPSPHVDWSAGEVRLLTEPEPWPAGERPRRAGVSSFGISGTNAHVILEEAPRLTLEEAPPQDGGSPARQGARGGPGDARDGRGEPDAQGSGSHALGVLPWLVSGRSEAALRGQAERLRAHLESRPELPALDVAYSLATTRAQHEWRAAIVASDRDGLLAGLAALSRGEPAGSVLEGRAAGGRVAFMLSGQGSQRAGMGAELHEILPRFRAVLDEVCAQLDRSREALGQVPEPSLREVLFAAEGSPEAALLDETELTQAALFAFEVALARQLEAWGVKPDLLIGHSIGEVVAAHLGGVFTLADACTLVAARGRLMGELPAGGAMLAIEASAEEVAQSFDGLGSRLAIAAVNGPRAVVVSGDVDAVEQLGEAWRERGRKLTRLRVSHAFHSQRMDPMLAELGAVVGGLAPSPPRSAVASNLTGELVADGAIGTPEYWMRHARETVRFADGVAALERAGARSFIEVGPDGVLCALGRGCLSADALEHASLVPAQRARGGELETLVKALAHAHTAGVPVDWRAFFAGSGARPVELPSYAFQRERYWLTSNDASGEVGAAGLGAAEHPLLGAAVQVAGGEEWLLTGRLSLATHPWIADHAVLDTVLLPGTAFLELAFAAGARAGVEAVEELTIEAPLVLAEGAAVQLQVSLAEPDEEGRRALAIHSRAERPAADGGEAAWTRHVSGVLVPAADVDPAIEHLQAQEWPPAGAEPVDVEYLYDRLAELGLGYGPAFQAVRKAWRRGEELFVEAALSERQAAEAESFLAHPALIDATLHTLFVAGEGQGAALPFSWSDVRLYREAATALRACVTASERNTLRIAALDELGAPLLSVGALVGRPVDASRLASTRESAGRDSLYGLEWVELTELSAPAEQERYAVLGEPGLTGVEAERYEDIQALCTAIEAGASVPEVLFADAPVPPSADVEGGSEQLAQAARHATQRTLELLQACLAAQELADTRLVLLTRGAVAIGEQEQPDLAAAPLVGLIASAQPEHPGRFLLVDLDGGDHSEDGDSGDSGEVPWARLLEADEPQLAVRAGRVYAPRLVAVSAAPEADAPALDPEGTVLITGGTGGLGALVARHLVGVHGARHLLLVSRRGTQAPGVAELTRELGELGAEVSVAACDVADRQTLGALLDSLPAAHRLTAVIHAAGVIDDGLLESLTAARVEGVMRPKVDAALHLHELTAGSSLAAFVLFSSFTATIGSPGQGNYAAANAFLDALARHRRGSGLPGNALAWGLWADADGMAGAIGEAGMARLGRLGIEALSNEQGLQLLDAALALDRPLLAPVALDPAVLRAQARMGVLPASLRGVVRMPARRGRDAKGSLARRLAGVADAEREGTVLELVRAQVAAVLGHDSPRLVDVERTFAEVGFDSLSAVELRNRLHQATGLRLPATLVFDHPTPTAVAKFLLAKVEGSRRHGSVLAHGSSSANDPVVIVGMSCRYPGGARTPAQLWELLSGGVDAITRFPRDRGWDVERLYDPDPDNRGTSYAREGGFLHDVADFDASFFGMGQREAMATDPQQRLVLETAWEALEDARIDPLSLRGTETGVFCGVMYQDYGFVVNASAQREEAEGYVTVGVAGSVVTGRLAYTFGLEGPAVTIDTACSSSLVALHLASQSLRQGECSMALVGGVTVLSNPTVFVDFSRARGLAPDGRCKSFAGAADGVGWAEGVGMLVVERLSAARRNGHRVLGVVRGSAVNQDGASNGLTAPNGPSQERVIRQALANAGLSAEEVDAVEGHGTGTTLGDPIEAQALLATYGQERAGDPLWLGSIKSNIGHTQAAAGAAGVMKMLLAMRHERLPRTLHVDEPSPHVDWSQGAVSLLSEPAPWPRGERPRRAGVSSFGVSGTNAHVILEEPPQPELSQRSAAPAWPRPAELPAQPDAALSPPPAAELSAHPDATPAAPGVAEQPAHVWLVSARGESALRAQAERLHAYLEEHPALESADVALTLAAARAQLESRAAVIGGDREELLAGLRALTGGVSAAGVFTGEAAAGGTAFMFTGQGAQRPGMGAELYEAFPVFKEALDEVCTELDRSLEALASDRSGGRPLREVLFAAEGTPEAALLERTEYTQPALFALELALFALVRSFGVKPDLLIGHSIGELVAAHVAGVLSLPDACALVAARGRLMGALPAGGAMFATDASESEVSASLAEHAGRLAIAAVNGPRSVVVTGEEQDAERWAQQWREQGHKTTRLRVSHAFHSHLMEPMLEDFRRVARGLSFAPPRIPVVSNVTGEQATQELATPDYWVRHVRETVRFADGVGALARAGVTRYLELGPDGVLCALAGECLDADAHAGALLCPALRARRAEAQAFGSFLGQAHVRGVSIDWSALPGGRGARLVDLPTYAFQRERHWAEADPGMGDMTAAGLLDTGHPLLGAGVQFAGRDEWLCTRRLSLATHPWIGDHAVLGTVLLPGTAFVELALAAGRQVGFEALEELTLETPLVFGEDAVQLQVHVGEPDDELQRRPILIYSRAQSQTTEGRGGEAGWIRHASGVLATSPPAREDAALEHASAQEWPPAGAEPVAIDFLYDRLAEAGLDYGPIFQGVKAAWRRGEEIFAEVALDEQHAGTAKSFGVHPALFDAALHAGVGLAERGPESSGVPLPFSFSGVRLHGEGSSALRIFTAPSATNELSLVALDAEGAPVLSVQALVTRPIDTGRLAGARLATRDALFALAWTELQRPAGSDVGPLRFALLGELEVQGLDAERYADLPSLAEAVGEGAPVPDVVVAAPPVATGGDRMPQAARAGAGGALALLQAWLAEPRLAEARLALVTRGAIAALEGEAPDLTVASTWGLVRSAQAEHPDRLLLVDLDPQGEAAASGGDLAAPHGDPAAPNGVSAASDGEPAMSWLELCALEEPQLALRGGRVLAPRLARVVPPAVPAAPWDSEGTVLITGGTGGLGALFARHLAGAHGVRRLVLTSRRGLEAEGAGELVEELRGHGCEARVVACDVSEREQCAALIEGIAPEHPLRGVIHAAGVLEDGMVDSLSVEQLERVMRPKVDGAFYLHELTERLGLSEFVLFSSAAGAIGSPGQANYAAGNAFLDALAQHRRARGLAGRSLAWGLWAQPGGMAGALEQADLARLGRVGVLPLESELGLELFDMTRAIDRALLVPARVDTAALRAQARVGMLPVLLRDLVRVPARRGGGRSLARRLAGMPPEEWRSAVLELVRGEVAAVLGYGSPQEVDPQLAFKDLGFDSLGAVELRNRLTQLTGLRLPATLVFDHPTTAAVATYLLSKVEGVEQGTAAVVRRAVRMDEPVAIVGMSCRYPGGVSSPEGLWRMLAAGQDAIRPFPADRGWDLERLYDPDPDHLGTSYVREGGFLDAAGEFDAGFFGIGPREAIAMDPQQRLLLEATWEVLEDAGIVPSSLRGSDTGVFCGLMYQDYGAGGSKLPEELEGYLATGAGGSVVSGRVAYTYGFEGPAVTLDTACSSSLVALHLACQSVRSGECALALAGGVTVLSTPMVFLGFSRQRGLAVDGRCKSFAAAADGVAWAEGVGLLAVERLSEARRRGHRVLAVVRGSAVNQDGASNGMTAPNGPSQERVIRQALANAGLASTDVDAVEGHGTGTTLGDPIEAQALLGTYGQGRPEDRPLWLGSIKSNMGHTQAAAGVAGVIKLVKALEHGVLPRTLHVDAPSDHVDWESGRVALLVDEVPWESNGAPRRAAVSSFGVSGTNAHIILEEPPATGSVPAGAGALTGDGHPSRTDGVPSVDGMAGAGSGAVVGVGGVVPWVISGRGDAGLRGQAERLWEFVEDHPALGAVDVGFSLAERSVFGERAVVLGGGREELLAGLGALRAGAGAAGLVQGAAGGADGVAFVFPGQGAQWEGMAVQLLDCSPVFGEWIGRCGEVLGGLVGWSLEGVLRGAEDEPGLDRVDVVQPVLWAVGVSLAGLWGACGVHPVAVVGHSQGEIAAVCVAGGLSLEDGARVVVSRSRALVGLSGLGGMVSIVAGVGKVEGWLEHWDGRVGVAAVNGPSSVVVSGDSEALEGLLGELEAEGVRARRIPVDYAAHSAHVEVIRGELLEGCEGIVPGRGNVPFYSAVTGGVLDMAELDGEYWYRNLRETVQFEQATRAVVGESGVAGFVEVSPHPVLTLGVQETLEEAGSPDIAVVGSLRREDGGLTRFLRSVGEMWVAGAEVDWKAVFAGSGGVRSGLPSYAFQREQFWLKVGVGAGDVAAAGLVSADHPLLGAAVGLADGKGAVFTGRLSHESHPWLADHAVMGVVLLPGTAFLELVLHAAGELGCPIVQELTLEAPLVLGERGAVQIQVVVGEPGEGGEPREEGERPVSVYSRVEGSSDAGLDGDGGWTRHASGVLAPGGVEDRVQARVAELAGSWPPVGATAVEIEVDEVYERLSEAGLEYGPAFQGLRAVWRREEEIFADVELGEEAAAQAGSFGVHPALLDSALHTLALALLGAGAIDGAGGAGTIRLPFAWGSVRLSATGATRLRVHLSGAGSGSESPADGVISLVAVDDDGGLVVSAGSLMTREMPMGQIADRGDPRESLFRVEWVPLAGDAGEEPDTEEWVVLGGGSEIARAIAGSGPTIEVLEDLSALRQALDAGARVPKTVLLDWRDGGREIEGRADRASAGRGPAGAAENAAFPGRALDVIHGALSVVQEWLADERLQESRLVVLTRAAVAARPGEGADDLAGAGVWGLLRSAQMERPGAILLVDVDDREESWSALGSAVAGEESQVALREGQTLAPRLARASTPAVREQAADRGDAEAGEDAARASLDPERSVLITGGTGVLGGLLARHLVANHGLRSVLLASRQGARAPGAMELRSELEELGARVSLVACDVSDRSAVRALLEEVPEEFPLGSVVHAAGALDDGLIESLTLERVQRVLAPKVDAAWHLHELTRAMDLQAFVLFSSVAGTFGSPGQGSYAAANAFLDALATHRRAQGLVGISMAWGFWEQATGLTGELDEVSLSRMKRAGVSALSTERGLELYDIAYALDEALLLPVGLDVAMLRRHAKAGLLPPLLRGLIRVPPRRAADRGSLVRRLAEAPEAEHEGIVLEVVRTETATVLGQDGPRAIDPERTFQELGFDSLTAVELRNRLNAVTGLRLDATLVFDYPRPAQVAGHILEQAGLDRGKPEALVDADIDRLQARLATVASEETERKRITSRLQALLDELRAPMPQEGLTVAERMQSASVDEVLDFIDRELES